MDFGSLLAKSAMTFGNDTAVVFDEERDTFADLYERSCRLANGLLGLGVTPGDRVATLSDNHRGSVEEIGGLALGGFVRCPMYTLNTPETHLYTLERIGATVLIVQEKYLDVLGAELKSVKSLKHVIVHGLGTESTIDYDLMVSAASSGHPPVAVHEDAAHIIRFSAGTTGKPKAIMHTNRGFLAMGNEGLLALPKLDEADSYLGSGPLSHATGAFIWPFIAHGVTTVVLPAFDPARWLELVEQERCTLSVLVPTMIQMIVNHPDASQRDLSSLRAILYGAAPITERTLTDALGAWGNIMYQLYGQSECLGISFLPPRFHHLEGTDEQRALLRSAGRPFPNVMVKIVGDDGAELPVGEVGEILVNSPGNMAGIWADPEATAERITPDDYVRTRDIGYLNEQGFLFLADRKEDMIISGGFNIWPAEVENALASHPAVLEAAVVGVPDDKWGETPLAAVVLREGMDATEEDLIAWAREKVGSVKKPTHVVFSKDPLPKSMVGKLIRRAVREQYWTDSERNIHGA